MPKKQASSAARMQAAGKWLQTLWWRPEAADAIREAADTEGVPYTQFVMRHALAAARKIVKKKENST
jgi:uncharacterized protein (DUF1778 family)